VLSKVIGYYEGWSNSRSCYAFPPSGIPTNGLTHVNFAFAYIDPTSYEIVTMESDMPSSLFVETADIRTLTSGTSDVKIFVSIGGWSFSDNDTSTQPVFSDIAASAANRETFANNLAGFLKQYGFDGGKSLSFHMDASCIYVIQLVSSAGEVTFTWEITGEHDGLVIFKQADLHSPVLVDLDWEYPGAPDRGGKTEDTENYVLLLQAIRLAFDESDGDYGISFTAPSSYWYLRWFDLPGMVEYADWINLMGKKQLAFIVR
jgi:chitinase